MRYLILIACFLICSCATRIQAQTETRSLTIQPRVDQFDTALFRLTDAAKTQNLINCGQGSALLGICGFANPADGRSANISGLGMAGNRIVALTQASLIGEVAMQEGAGGNRFLIMRAAGSMASDVTLSWPAANASGTLTNDGAGNLSWTPGGGAFVCSTANNCVNLTDSQSIGGTKTFTADVNMQSNALIFNTLTLGDTLSRGRVLVQGTNFVDEIVLEANRDGFGDSFRLINNSGATKVFGGTIDSGNSGSLSTIGTVSASMRGGTGGAGGLAGHYIGSTQRITPVEFKSSDGTSGITNPACNSPFNLKDGIVVGCS